MNACPFEELSAWLDGEATPDESARVESHLKVCPRCRQTTDLMVSAGSTLARVEVALPPIEALRPRRLPQPWRFPSLRWPDHPIAMLRRKPAALPGVATVLALFGLPALLFAVLSPEQAQVFLGLTAVGLLFGLPLHHFKTEVSVLTSLRRGRCLEEILSTGLPARQLVDTLAVQSMGAVARIGLPLVPVLAVGSQVFPDRGQALTAALAWLPLVLLVFWLGSYYVLFLGAWSQDGDARNLPQQGLAAAVLLPAVALAVFAHPLLGVLWFAMTARSLAVWGLDHLAQVDQLMNRRIHRARNRWLNDGSDNPIVARESIRRSAAVPGGLGGLVVARALPVLLPLVWVLALFDNAGSADGYWKAYFGGAFLFALLAWARGASLTLGAVTGERERGTWEVLLQTGLSHREFVQGWLKVAACTLALDFLPAAAVVVVVALDAGLPGPLGALLVLAGMAWSGAHAGLAGSALSSTAREANGRLLAMAGYGLVGWLSLSALGAGLLNWLHWARLFEPPAWRWTLLLMVDIPGLALLLTGVLANFWSRRALARHLNFTQPVPAASELPAGTRRLVLLCSAVSGMAASLFLGLWPSMGPWGTDLLVRVLAGGGLATLLGLGLNWLAQPVVAALSARMTTRRRAIGLSTVIGAGCGLGVALAPMALQSLAWIDFLPVSWSRSALLWSPEVVAWGLAAGTFCGTMLGCGAALAAAAPLPRLAPALRRTLARLAATGLVAAALLLVLGASLMTYEVKDPAQMAALEAETRARHRESTGSGPLWKAIQPDRKSTSIHPLASAYNGDRNALRVALQDPRRWAQIRDFRRQFEAPLRAAVKNPDFMPAEVNFLRVRGVSHCLVATAAMGSEDEAVDLNLLGLHWGGLLSGRGTLMHEMVALSVLSVHVQDLLRLLQPGSSLSPAACRRILAETASLPFGPESFGRSMDAQTVADLDYIAKLQRGESVEDEPLAGALRLLPGFYFDYQRKLYTNLYLAERPYCYQLHPLPTDILDELGSTRSAQLVQYLFPGVGRAISRYQHVLTDFGAVRLGAALRLYRAERGSYPERLEELVPAWLPGLPRNYLAGGHYIYQRLPDGCSLSCRYPWNDSYRTAVYLGRRG